MVKPGREMGEKHPRNVQWELDKARREMGEKQPRNVQWELVKPSREMREKQPEPKECSTGIGPWSLVLTREKVEKRTVPKWDREGIEKAKHGRIEGNTGTAQDRGRYPRIGAAFHGKCPPQSLPSTPRPQICDPKGRNSRPCSLSSGHMDFPGSAALGLHRRADSTKRG